MFKSPNLVPMKDHDWILADFAHQRGRNGYTGRRAGRGKRYIKRALRRQARRQPLELGRDSGAPFDVLPAADGREASFYDALVLSPEDVELKRLIASQAVELYEPEHMALEPGVDPVDWEPAPYRDRWAAGWREVLELTPPL